LNFSLEFKL